MEVKVAVELVVEQMGLKPFSDKQVLYHKIYHIRTNIGGYNIWRFVEIMDLARY